MVHLLGLGSRDRGVTVSTGSGAEAWLGCSTLSANPFSLFLQLPLVTVNVSFHRVPSCQLPREAQRGPEHMCCWAPGVGTERTSLMQRHHKE